MQRSATTPRPEVRSDGFVQELGRVHLILTPDHARVAHWKDEASYRELWVDPPPGGRINDNHQHMPDGTDDVSGETHHLELEGPTGVCIYLRQNLEILIWITTSDTAVGLAG